LCQNQRLNFTPRNTFVRMTGLYYISLSLFVSLQLTNIFHTFGRYILGSKSETYNLQLTNIFHTFGRYILGSKSETYNLQLTNIFHTFGRYILGSKSETYNLQLTNIFHTFGRYILGSKSGTEFHTQDYICQNDWFILYFSFIIRFLTTYEYIRHTHLGGIYLGQNQRLITYNLRIYSTHLGGIHLGQNQRLNFTPRTTFVKMTGLYYISLSSLCEK
jgi:hypothetical protein